MEKAMQTKCMPFSWTTHFPTHQTLALWLSLPWAVQKNQPWELEHLSLAPSLSCQTILMCRDEFEDTQGRNSNKRAFSKKESGLSFYYWLKSMRKKRIQSEYTITKRGGPPLAKKMLLETRRQILEINSYLSWPILAYFRGNKFGYLWDAFLNLKHIKPSFWELKLPARWVKNLLDAIQWKENSSHYKYSWNVPSLLYLAFIFYRHTM